MKPNNHPSHTVSGHKKTNAGQEKGRMKYNQYAWLALLAIVFVCVYAYTFDSKLDLNGDNVNYMNLATNISKGLGYSSNTLNGTVPASHYPPGYSALLSVFMALGIQSLFFFKIVNGALLFLSLAGLFYLVKKIKDNVALAFSAVVLAMFSPQTLHFSSIVMSEMLFLFCCVACFYCLYRYSEEKPEKFWKSPYFYLSIVFAVAAYYTRTVAAALLVALVVFFLFRKEWLQAAAAVAGCILLNLPWSLRNAYYGIESRYFGTIMTVNPWRPEMGTISSPEEMVKKMITNFDETVIKGFREILFPFLNTDYQQASGFWGVLAGLLILGLIFYGAWNMRRLKWALIAFLLGQIGLFMLWHGGNGSRYVVPIAPLLFVCFYTGVYSLIRLKWKADSKMTANVPFAFLFVVLLMLPPVRVLAGNSKLPHPPAYQNYFAIAKELKKHAKENTVCCCRKPELFSYYADNVFTARYLYTQDTDELIRDLIRQKVDYVILEQLGYSSTGLYLYPAIQANPELFPVVWKLPNPDTYLLKFELQKAVEKLGGGKNEPGGAAPANEE